MTRRLLIAFPAAPVAIQAALQLIDFAGHALFGVHLGLGPL